MDIDGNSKDDQRDDDVVKNCAQKVFHITAEIKRLGFRRRSRRCNQKV
jgi:hypothetical protein